MVMVTPADYGGYGGWIFQQSCVVRLFEIYCVPAEPTFQSPVCDKSIEHSQFQ